MENSQNNNPNSPQGFKNFFLQSSARKLFLLFVICPFVSGCIIISIIGPDRNPKLVFMLISLIMIAYIILFFGWLYILGISLYSKLPKEANMNINFFKFNLIYIVLYLVLIITIINLELEKFLNNSLLFFVYIYAGFSILYVPYFVSKALASVEKQQIAKFSDYLGVLFMFWYLPFGIWTLQLRIKKIFNQ